MGNKVDHIIVERASEMRKNPTEEEKKKWHIILKHIKPRFIRQKIIGYYIVDFYCPKLKLIIEIDGEQHYIDENKDYEERRTGFLEKSGYKLLRFYNSDINKKINDVEKTIIGTCQDRAKELGVCVDILFE